jgi:hypothetical protein
MVASVDPKAKAELKGIATAPSADMTVSPQKRLCKSKSKIRHSTIVRVEQKRDIYAEILAVRSPTLRVHVFFSSQSSAYPLVSGLDFPPTLFNKARNIAHHTLPQLFN